jgi:hypothetical protein
MTFFDNSAGLVWYIFFGARNLKNLENFLFFLNIFRFLGLYYNFGGSSLRRTLQS